MSQLKIFLSYRHDDLLVRGTIPRIHERLEAEFGENNIFMDFDAIPPGRDFREVLTEAVSQTNVVLALIGPQWTEIMIQRLDDPRDFVQVELEAALERNVPIIPILVGHNQMPLESQLPTKIARIVYHQAMPMDPSRDYEAHMTRLVTDLRSHFMGTGSVTTPEPAEVSHMPSPGSEFINGVGMDMVWCQPGTFQMGSPLDEFGRYEHELPHQVTLSKGYWIGRYAVTQDQWVALVGENPSRFKDGSSSAPVERVNWEEAADFCKRLSERERQRKSVPDGWEYRLPSGAQWEYACRAGTDSPYSHGDSLDPDLANYDSTRGQTAEVGSYPANPWGIYDMHGNVWEWCQDWNGDYPMGPVTDPRGAGHGRERIARGGAWFSPARDCRSAARMPLPPTQSFDFLGLRVVLTAMA